MRRAKIQIGWLLLGASYMAAQALGPASIRNVQVVDAGSDVRIELTLSTPVTPSVIVATNPDRLVLELPNTSSEGKQKRVAVHSRGIKGVRMGLHQAEPPVTNVVVDLDSSAPYRVQTEKNRITLIISPASVARVVHTPPARAVSGGLGGIFRSASKPLPSSSTSNDSAELSSPVSTSISGSATSASGQAGTSSPNTGPAITVNTTTASTPEIRTAAPGSSFPAVSMATPEAPMASRVEESKTTATANSEVGTDRTKDALPTEASATPNSADPGRTDQTPVPLSPVPLQIADSSLRTVFRVKYVADGVVYLDGGSSSGLDEGMKLEVRDTTLPPQQGSVIDPNAPSVISGLQITAVAETSAVADIHDPKRPVKVGDLAYLSAGDVQNLIQQRTLSATRKYPAVVTFTDDEALDEEGHDEVERPPLPSVNRSRGMFGFDYLGTTSTGSSALTSSNAGFLTRLDVTRIGGTYWNVRGYWRGRISSESVPSQPTLQDLINRTYHLNMTYENPNSMLVAGFGRLYLPWAPSLDTIDGGYFGARLPHGSTMGIFAGSTPDPTSWSYNPDGKIAGAFINFEGGSYEDLHYSSTSGFGLNGVKWQITRPFVFLENSISYRRYISIYDSLQADSPSGTPATPAPGAGLGRNFLTIRIQPHPRLEFDVNHNYFRDVPTFDPQLIGTGLLDKYLFQGLSAGVRVEGVKQVWVYTEIGQSNRTGDSKSSLNQSFGITFKRLPRIGVHADLHYSRFSSSFGNGSYRAFSLSRNLRDAISLEVLLGDESFSSSLTSNNRSRFINLTAETSLGAHYFFQGGFTVDRGSMNYNQWMFTLGYRFDSRMKRQ